MNEDKRKRTGDFIENLSIILVLGAFLAGYIVLFDIRATLTIYGQIISIGKDGFASEVKGMVLQSMMITGFAAVVAYWLGTTKQGQDQAQSMNKIAETAAPTTALAVAASRADPAPPVPVAPLAPAPLQAENVNVQANTLEVNPTKGTS